MSLKYTLKWTQKDCSEIVALCKKYRTTIVGLADNHLQSISGVRQNEIHPYRQAIGHPYRPSTAHHNANDISYITRSKANINLIILQKSNFAVYCISARAEGWPLQRGGDYCITRETEQCQPTRFRGLVRCIMDLFEKDNRISVMTCRSRRFRKCWKEKPFWLKLKMRVCTGCVVIWLRVCIFSKFVLNVGNVLNGMGSVPLM